MNRSYLVACILLTVTALDPANAGDKAFSNYFTEVAKADPLNYTNIVELIRKNKITSIESLLPLLPSEFRSNYSLMYASRSLQSAKPLDPRAILYGSDGSLTCAFNGDSSEANFDTLECIQFLKNERRFDFRQIEFPSPRNKLTKVLFSASGRSADKSISCSQCHGAEPRPNWDEYSTWPGAYGSLDDGMSDEERQNYNLFVAQMPTHPRYQYLGQNGPFDRPNLTLSEYFVRMTAYQDARLLENKVQKWQALAFAFSALGCTLSDDQKSAITLANLPLQNDTNLDLIYSKTGVTAHDWTTEIFSDTTTHYPTDTTTHGPYEHLGGYSFLSEDVAMEILAEQAKAGDQNMTNILQKIYGQLIPNISVFENILVDMDHFGNPSDAALVCPEAALLFVDSYLKSNSKE